MLVVAIVSRPQLVTSCTVGHWTGLNMAPRTYEELELVYTETTHFRNAEVAIPHRVL